MLNFMIHGINRLHGHELHCMLLYYQIMIHQYAHILIHVRVHVCVCMCTTGDITDVMLVRSSSSCCYKRIIDCQQTPSLRWKSYRCICCRSLVKTNIEPEGDPICKDMYFLLSYMAPLHVIGGGITCRHVTPHVIG